jgi:hypothetical protein
MFSFAPVGLSSSNDCVSAFTIILHRPLCSTVYPSLTYQFTRVEGSTSPIQGTSSSRSSKEDRSIREKRKKNKEPPKKMAINIRAYSRDSDTSATPGSSYFFFIIIFILILSHIIFFLIYHVVSLSPIISNCANFSYS